MSSLELSDSSRRRSSEEIKVLIEVISFEITPESANLVVKQT